MIVCTGCNDCGCDVVVLMLALVVTAFVEIKNGGIVIAGIHGTAVRVVKHCGGVRVIAIVVVVD